MANIKVSVIIVCRNEERYIERCIDSIINQFEENNSWELIVVDGISGDRTVELVKSKLVKSDFKYLILENPKRILASGWNIGIKNASGDLVVRPDAHAILQPGYISTACDLLDKNSDISAVGGLLKTEADSFTGKIIQAALSMRTGVGNSSFRTGAGSGFSDTVVYGVYRKKVFDKLGYFNEDLNRHQDTEFHYRMKQAGFKLYLCDKISATYYCRDSIAALAKQLYAVGYNFRGLVKAKMLNAMQLRHWMPLLFFVFLLLLICLKLSNLFYVVVAFYLFSILSESLIKSISGKNIFALGAVFVIPIMHLFYAAGTLAGFVSLVYYKFK